MFYQDVCWFDVQVGKGRLCHMQEHNGLGNLNGNYLLSCNCKLQKLKLQNSFIGATSHYLGSI